jgi:hypothetical protein
VSIIYDTGSIDTYLLERRKKQILGNHLPGTYFGKYTWSGLAQMANWKKFVEAMKAELQFAVVGQNKAILLLTMSECAEIIEITFQSRSAWIEYLGTEKGWAKTKLKVDEFLEPILDHETRDKLNVSFIFNTKRGMRAHDQRIVCPSWKNIRGNYANAEKIDKLLKLEKPDEHGKLIFWHGTPGTGKTFCIRALMQEWRRRADMIYIMDPEDFFGEPAYMFEALMMDEDYHGRRPRFLDDDEDDEDLEKDRFKLLIVEDALDLILADNRRSMSAPMSRLLNLTEGIVGQGFRMVVLVTTNEDITNVDEAFMRPGRCIQSLEFPKLSTQRSEEWLKKHGLRGDEISAEQHTLAELYQVVHEKQLLVEGAPEAKPIGFMR